MAKRRYHRPPPREREPRINQRIRVPKLRVIVDGEARIIPTEEALQMAKAQGLDLVEVSPDQDPPVAKIIDYGKYKYEQQKKKKEAARNQHTIHIKEVKLRPKIADHDYDLKRRNAHSFLEAGDKVKVTLRFRGREITHPELGMKLMDKLAKDLTEVGQVEAPARQDGRQIVMVLAPRPGMRKKVQEKQGSEQGKKGDGGGKAPKKSGDEQGGGKKEVAGQPSSETVSAS